MGYGLRRRAVQITWLLLLIPPVFARAAAYDPLAVDTRARGEVLELRASDPARDRAIPLLVYLPAGRQAAPVVLFSHGLGGHRRGNAYLGEHWSARGYVVVFVQHPGSDDAVWRKAPLGGRLAAMQQAASLENFQARVHDVRAVIDQLAVWQQQDGHALHERLNLQQLGMSGHSFGALTTQAVSGQFFPLVGQQFTDGRIRAAIALSPSVPLRGDAAKAFASVKMPWLLMTGTHDAAIIGGQTPESRLGVFPHLPPGNKYQLVLDKAEHSAFSDRRLPGESQPRNPNHHRAVLAISSAFWDAWLRLDPAAREWLGGDGPRRVLEPADRWQTK